MPAAADPSTERKLVNLIRRMRSSNPTWGSKGIQAEMAKLGIEVSDSTIRKYRPRTRRGDQTWNTFLHNHAKDLIAVDFFVVRTANDAASAMRGTDIQMPWPKR